MALIEGFRMPNLWSINYYIPSIFDGFVRRSMGGTFLWIFGDIRFNYYFITFFQFLILFIILCLIFRSVRNNLPSLTLASLYFLSPLGGYFFHEVGYIDQLLYLLLFASLHSFIKGRLFLSIVILTGSIFFHEIALLVTLPVLLFYIFLNTFDVKLVLKAALLPTIAFFTVYVFFQTVSSDVLTTLIDQIRLNSSYNMRESYFNVFSNEFLGSRMKFYYAFDNIFSISIIIILSFGLFFLLNLFNKNYYLKFFSLLPIFSPLLLGLFGWDTDRWVFISFTNFMIISYFIYNKFKDDFVRTTINSFLLSTMLIAFLSIPNLQYFDGYDPRMGINKQSLNEIYIELKRLPSR